MNSKLTKTVDKNVNTLKNAYNYQNRLTAMKNQTGNGVVSGYTSEYIMTAKEKEEEKYSYSL